MADRCHVPGSTDRSRSARGRRFVGHELGTEIVDVGDELALQLVDQIQQSVAIEVDPDDGAGDAALVAGEGADVGRTHGVDRSLFAGN